jgi:lipopolysaccharide heptosyltransferase II
MTSRKLNLLRSIDRWVGPALCRRIRPTHDRTRHGGADAQACAAAVRKILVIRPGGLGDAVLTLPLLRELRARYPHAALDVLGEQRNIGVYAIADIADDVYCYDTKPLRTFRRLRRNGYDLVVDTEQYHSLSAVFAHALRPRYLCGFETLGRSRLHTHSAPLNEDTYEVVSFLNLAETLSGSNLPFDPDQAFLDVQQCARSWAEKSGHSAGMDEFVTVMPGAGGPYRRWSPARYAKVVSWLNQRGYGVILLGGQDCITTAAAITAENQPDRVMNLAGKTTLAQTAALLQRARLSLSADTGVMHLAYAVGTPTVSLFGPGLHRKWAPPGRGHRVVRKALACSPCTRFGRVPRCPHNVACMQQISVADVIAACDALLEQ